MIAPALNLTAPHSAATLRLLESIVEVTSQQDCMRFRLSLVETLRQVINVQEVLFVRPTSGVAQARFIVLYGDVARGVVRSEEPAERLSVQLVDPEGVFSPQGILQMMQAGHGVRIGPSGVTVLLPVMHRDSLVEIMALRALSVSADMMEMLKAFVRLYRNFVALINESERDAMTGLYNRKTLELKLRSLIVDAADAHRQRRSSAKGVLNSYLAIFDIDHFKRINDSLGHLFGDEVIILVSRFMKEVFRETDTLFRYGGDEFIVVLLAEDAQAAASCLDRFRQRISEHRFPQMEQLTVSIGFVELPAAEVPSSIVGKADQALYEAKKLGRNRVVDHASLSCAQAPAHYGEVDLF